MIESSVQDRANRGIILATSGAVEYVDTDHYLVQGRGDVYACDVDEQWCSCVDNAMGHTCKHLYAATYIAARTRVAA